MTACVCVREKHWRGNKHCAVRFHFVHSVVAPVALFLRTVQPSSTWRRIWLSPSPFAQLFESSKSGGGNALGPPRPVFWGDKRPYSKVPGPNPAAQSILRVGSRAPRGHGQRIGSDRGRLANGSLELALSPSGSVGHHDHECVCECVRERNTGVRTNTVQ